MHCFAYCGIDGIFYRCLLFPRLQTDMTLAVAGKYLTRKSTSLSRKVGALQCQNKSSNCTLELMPSLRQWHEAVEEIPTSQILPAGFGNKSGIAVKEAAWHGDKLIGEKIALQLHTFLFSMKDTVLASDELKHNIGGDLRMLYNVAVSNQLFADNLKMILPLHAPRNIAIVSQQKVHDAGTMIEAAVSAVSRLSDPKKHESIAILAKYLIVQAAQNMDTTLPRKVEEKLMNYMKVSWVEQKTKKVCSKKLHLKSVPQIEQLSEDRALMTLNQYGGKVDCIALRQNPAKFRATASLDGTHASSEASRKKLAQRQAAFNLLSKMKKAQKKHI